MSESGGNSPRLALVTGGASGIGLGVAKAIIEQGGRVALGDIHAEKLRQAADDLSSADVVPIELDVRSPASVRSALDRCRETLGGLDALVNCAGVIRITPLADISEQEWDQVVDVDLKGVFLCCQAAAPMLRESGRGRIVNIGSDASKVGVPMLPHYCAAKAGVVGLTRSLAGELAPYQVTVNCVCPVGVSGTGMGREILDWKVRALGRSPGEILASTAAGIPLRRNPTVDDVVHVVMMLLSDESSFLTGLAIDVDGGMLSTVPMPGAG